MLVYLASRSLLLIYLAHCFFECLSLHWCIFMKLILSIFFFFCHRDTQASGKLSFNREFFDERWSRHRTVTCLDWSTQVQEDDNLLLLLCLVDFI